MIFLVKKRIKQYSFIKNKAMNNEEKDLDKTEEKTSNEEVNMSTEDQGRIEAMNALQDDIIRNDTIPETSRNTPGSNGAFPVGAFDTSKDY